MKAFFLLLWITLGSVMVIAQQNTFQNLVKVDTRSPDVAALGKFGNIPVNYNTGATSVSIPIFEINIGKIKLPISLDYHTGGIKVDETASSVGLGWVLSGIGNVSRNVVNLPDDGQGGYLTSPPADMLYNDWAHGGGQYGPDVDAYYAQWLNNFLIGAVEADPDIYSYSANGQSGKFIFRRDRSIMQIPHTNNQIIEISGGFQITDASGLIYVFDLANTVSRPQLTQNYTGTWRLSKIIDPDLGETVLFNYDQACTLATDHFWSHVYNFILPSQFCPLGMSQGDQSSGSTTDRYGELFPSSITWRGGKIVFSNSCDRTDRASEKRLDHASVYSIVNGQQKLIKTVQLYQSYFYSNVVSTYSSTDERNYRLRLDAVSVLPTTGDVQPQTYRMTYNDGDMAPRESIAQDIWGFNNGAFNNTSLIPEQWVTFNTVKQLISQGNNRNPDADKMKVWMLKSIQYPTGGKSVFEFEPHQWSTNKNYTQSISQPFATNGAATISPAEWTWTPDALGSNYVLTYSISRFDNNWATDRPKISITDQTAGTTVNYPGLLQTPSQPINNFANPIPWSPIVGHVYHIVIDLHPNRPAPSDLQASLNISYTRTFPNIPLLDFGGGLRVRSVTNYDINGTVIGKDVYKYGIGEDGRGQLLTPANYLQVTSKIVKYACSQSGGTGQVGCATNLGGGLTIYASSVYPASQFSGSPVLYPSVTKYQLDASGYPTNGKSVYSYSIYDDQPAIASNDYQLIGVLLITNDWKNGGPPDESHYKYDPVTGNYSLVQVKTNDVQVARDETLPVVKVQNAYVWAQNECHLQSMQNANTEFLLVQTPVHSGAMLMQSSTVTNYGTDGTPLTTTENYSYNDPTHLFPTSKSTVDSKNISDVTNLKYPHDLASGNNVYAEMVAKNIISPTVQSQRVYNGVQVDLHNLNYRDWTGGGTLLQPSNVEQQVRSNPIETRVLFNQYDTHGNILQQQKSDDRLQSYIWDYNSVYPVATCINAAVSSIAATSFEADGNGGWIVPGGAIDGSSITGRRYYSLTGGACTKSGLDAGTSYVISYWSKNGVCAVSGSASYIQGKAINGWTYFEHKVTGVTSASVSGGAIIDELRLYPKDAQMSTFTYDPLIGITSQCDVANKITYYEYDGLNRLKDVKDQDGNIIKTYDYHYHVNN
jgi:hypothetical protein